MSKRPSVSTGAGDRGESGLLDHTRVPKYDLRIEAYGTLDEASAFLGLARAKADKKEIEELLRTIQSHIYFINSELACPPESQHLLKRKIEPADLDLVEQRSQDIEAQLELPRKFVLYGQTELSAHLDVARSVIRRAERRIVELNAQKPLVNPTILPYLNRISDTLFLLARYHEKTSGVGYAHPESVSHRP